MECDVNFFSESSVLGLELAQIGFWLEGVHMSDWKYVVAQRGYVTKLILNH